MSNLEKLVMDYSWCIGEISRLKFMASAEYSSCTGGHTLVESYWHFGEAEQGVTCVEYCYETKGSTNFKRRWRDLLEHELVCPHCIEARRLKQERMKVVRKLGGVRAAITKAGRKLAVEKHDV